MDIGAKWIETDVLVIGSGGAGLQAALSAREQGVDVALTSKTGPDEPNCTVWTAGYFTHSTPESEDELFRQVVTVGGFLNNQKLVDTFVREVPERMEALRGYGVDFEVLADGEPKMPGHIKLIKSDDERIGFSMTRPMRAEAERRGVEFLDSTVCTQLRRGGNGSWVAEAADLTEGVRILIGCKAVVIASGGGAGAFERNDNPPGTTGDGIVLAYEAGAELVDLELVSFQFPRDRIETLFELKTVPGPSLLRKGAAHYFLGGIRINERAETSLPGLFAAGEVTGGLFGAARLGGSAMGDIVVFGALAGENAAEYARRAELASGGQRTAKAVETTAEHGSSACSTQQGQLPRCPVRPPREAGNPMAWRREGVVAPELVGKRVREHLWRYLGTMKNSGSIDMARIALCRADEDLHRARVETIEDLRGYTEARFMLALGQLLTLVTEQRRETRGCYWRIDYPDFDNENCLHNIVLHKEATGPGVEVCPIVTTRMTEPTKPMVGAGCFGYLRP